MSAARPGESSARPSQSRRWPGWGTSRGEDALREHERGDPDRQVDEEDPAPGEVVDEPAAEDRAEDRPEQHRHADDRHHAADAVRAGGLREDRHAERHQHAAAEALQDAEGDQRARPPGEAGEHRAADEEGDRDHVQALGAEAVGGPAGERDHGGERQRVAGRRPTGSSTATCRTRARACDRDVDDGHVEDRHDRAEHDDRGDEQDAAVELVVVGGRGSGGAGEADIACQSNSKRRIKPPVIPNITPWPSSSVPCAPTRRATAPACSPPRAASSPSAGSTRRWTRSPAAPASGWARATAASATATT